MPAGGLRDCILFFLLVLHRSQCFTDRESRLATRRGHINTPVIDIMNRPTPSPAGPSPQPARTPTRKLRDSCHNCAAVKLRCSKEKPTCARCAKRGKNCEYFATKRAGRRPGSWQSSTVGTVDRATQTVASSSSLDLAGPEQGATTAQPDCGQAGLPHTTSHSPRDLDLLWGPLPPPNSDSVSTLESIMNFDDVLGTPIDFSVLGTPDGDKGALWAEDFGLQMIGLSGHADAVAGPLAVDYNTGAGLEDTDFLMTAAVPGPQVSSFISQATAIKPSLTNSNSKQAPSTSSDSVEHGCIMRALGLLGRLSKVPRGCTFAGSNHGNSTDQPLPTIDRIIAENGEAIETINEILTCPCSQDGYLLCIMSLVVFKILGRFAAAGAAAGEVARETPRPDGMRYSSSDSSSAGSSGLLAANQDGRLSYSEQVLGSPTVVGSNRIDGEEQGRMAAQVVLSELHRVQRVVNKLSQRLRGHTGSLEEVGNVGLGVRDQTTSKSSVSEKVAFPLSPMLLSQLETDICKHIRALSAEIVEGLRRD